MRQGASLADCKQGCPLAAAGECAVLELKVDVATFLKIEPGNDPNFDHLSITPTDPRFHAAPVLGTPTHLTLTTDKQKRGQQTAVTDTEIKNLLSRYDLVLETITDAPTRDEPWPRGRIALNAEAKYRGPCTVQKHPAIYELPLNETPELPPGGAYWEATKTEERKFYARKIIADTLNSTTPWGFFMSLLDQLTCPPKLIEIQARACGATHWYSFRRDEDINLNCLLRIFRKDKWSLKLTIASYRTTSYTRTRQQAGWLAQGNPANTEGTTDTRTRVNTTGGTTVTDTQKHTSGFRDRNATTGVMTDRPAGTVTSQSTQTRNLLSTQSQTRTTSNDPRGNMLAVQTHDIPGSQHQEFVVTANGQPPKGEGWERVGDGWTRTMPQESPPPRVDLTITRNGVPLKVLEDLRKFIEGVIKLRDIINRFGELLKKAPQAGWSFSYSFAFLEGSVEGTIERIQPPGQVIEGRYIPVGWKGTVTFQLMLVSFTATASFGVKFDMSWLASAEATLNGTFKTDIPLKGTINTDGDCEIGLFPNVTAEVSGVLKASAVGVQLLDVSVKLTGGITIMDAKTRKPGGLTWKNKGGGFGFKGDLCTTDILLKITATSAAGGMEPQEYKLLGPVTLMNLAQQPSQH